MVNQNDLFFGRHIKIFLKLVKYIYYFYSIKKTFMNYKNFFINSIEIFHTIINLRIHIHNLLHCLEVDLHLCQVFLLQFQRQVFY